MTSSIYYAPALTNKKQIYRMTEQETDFSAWLSQAMQRRGMSKQTALAAASGLAQSTISSYLSGARTPEKREQVEKLVKALLQPDADEDIALRMLNAGLLASGLAPADTEPDDHEVIDFLRGQPPTIQDKALRMLKAAFAEDDAIDNAGNIGKRAN